MFDKITDFLIDYESEICFLFIVFVFFSFALWYAEKKDKEYIERNTIFIEKHDNIIKYKNCLKFENYYYCWED